jgi:hypothetical protein
MNAEKTLKAAVISEGHNASSDYFIFPYLQNLNYQTDLIDSRLPLENFPLSNYHKLVICRYISAQQLSYLEKLAAQTNVKIIYFMDDDLFDLRALHGLPKRYQWKILTKAFFHRQRLKKLCAQFWVSTRYLADKYTQLQPLLLNPVALPCVKTSQKPVFVCYHGTSSHGAEIDWLLTVIEAVQARSEHIYFELFGTQAVAKIAGKLPRVSVLHQMSWENYLSFTCTQTRDIGLAPLLTNRFNAARGATKFYDYARMGAVGLYSDVPPYQGFIRDGVDGFLVPNQPDLWVEKLLQLADNQPQRTLLSAQIQQRLMII